MNSGLRLQLKHSPPSHLRIDLRGLTPAAFGNLTLSEIQRTTFVLDGKVQALGEWFSISGDPSLLKWTLAGQLDCVDFIGHKLDEGCITVESNVGHFLGQQMRSGSIHVQGDAGHYCGSLQRGGEIVVGGDAGHYVGGACPGVRHGLRGGMLLIRGNVGNYLGYRQRRGTIVVHGSTGTGLAMRMIAGTIAVCGPLGSAVGCGMRRGTLLRLVQSQDQDTEPFFSAPGFTTPSQAELSFLPILLQALRPMLPAAWQQHFTGRDPRLPKRGLRSLGDRTCGGLGELITLTM